MQMINLDKFAIKYGFNFLGQDYTVRGTTVQEFMDQRGAALPEGSTEQIIERLKNLTDCPEPVLTKMDLKQLLILFQLSQGVMPTEGEDSSKN